MPRVLADRTNVHTVDPTVGPASKGAGIMAAATGHVKVVDMAAPGASVEFTTSLKETGRGRELVLRSTAFMCERRYSGDFVYDSLQGNSWGKGARVEVDGFNVRTEA